VRIPLLRERRQDIPLLATAFLERVSQSSSRPVELSDDAMKALLDYDWPGNVRELENCLETLLRDEFRPGDSHCRFSQCHHRCANPSHRP